MYSDNLVIKLNAIAHQYADVIKRSLKEILSQYRNTGAGVASIEVKVTQGNSSQAPRISIKVDDHLMYLDKKKLQWTKVPDIDNLTKWAETKSSDEKVIKKLVWSTAWKQKKYDIWKTKAWRKKGLGPALKEMNKMIIDGFEKAIEEDLNNAIKSAA